MKLEIKEPCHENWDNMKIGVISRHCEVCEKSVMDFTKMNRAEIITYILSNPNDEVCGRLNKDQFDFHHDDIPILIETLQKTRPSNSFLILALVCLSLTSCAQESPSGNIKTPPPIEQNLGKVEAKPLDSIPTRENDTTQLRTKGNVSTEVIAGEVVLIDPPVAGGICIEGPLMGDIVEPPLPELPTEDQKIYQFAEKMPEYPGGMEPLFVFIQENLNYPEYEKENGIQGNVYVRFVVGEKGEISNMEILRSVDGSRNFDKEVLRVLKLMKNWNPGENNGKKVPVYMTLPFRFKLVN